jgi:20S proteasome subunit alpha 2
MSDGSYSFSLTTFSPNGKLVQIEYALQAVSQGKTALGIKARNGVVIATEKKAGSVLLDETSLQKVHNLTQNIGVTYSGMGPDFRVLLKRGRKSAQKYKRVYGEDVPVSKLVKDVATVMQEFTQSGGVRPFGVSLLAAGVDDDGPQLYQIDPSGSYWAWKASAVGKRQISAKSFLEKRYSPEMELEDAIHTAILTLKEGMEGAISENNIEIGIVGADKKFKLLSPQEVKEYLEEVQ